MEIRHKAMFGVVGDLSLMFDEECSSFRVSAVGGLVFQACKRDLAPSVKHLLCECEFSFHMISATLDLTLRQTLRFDFFVFENDESR